MFSFGTRVARIVRWSSSGASLLFYLKRDLSMCALWAIPSRRASPLCRGRRRCSLPHAGIFLSLVANLLCVYSEGYDWWRSHSAHGIPGTAAISHTTSRFHYSAPDCWRLASPAPLFLRPLRQGLNHSSHR
ncbi:hypothetical protein NDU88_003867 [Pleurodeles waltl]|uniref:Uncharacterized protein n=1 Tax=Pleurodeles waltl TaxID=8319 RepID=A0AAV7QCX0_PLEWA|nr:hypothetical protein NDU88_003867 [Pleurodeles waltl]